MARNRITESGEIIRRLARQRSRAEIARRLARQSEPDDSADTADDAKEPHVLVRIISFPFIIIGNLLLGVAWLILGIIIACLGWVPGAVLGILFGSVLGFVGRALTDRISTAGSIANIAFFAGVAGGFLFIIKFGRSANRKSEGVNKLFLTLGILLGLLIVAVLGYNNAGWCMAALSDLLHRIHH